MRFIYIALIAGLYLFFLLYKEDLSLVIFLSCLILPAVLFVFILFISGKVGIISAGMKESVKKGDNAKICISVRNGSFFPVSAAQLSILIKKEPLGLCELQKVTMPLPARSTENVTVSLGTNHCGRIVCEIKELRIYDVLALTSLKIKKAAGVYASVDFLPAGNIPLDSGCSGQLSVRESISGEASFSSRGKISDEYDELRDYRDGDKLNKVAWKLCGKQGDPDSYIVRDSEKGREAVYLLIADVYSAKDEKKLDTLYELFYTAADTMCSHEIAFDSIKADNTILENISLTDNFSECIEGIYGENSSLDEIASNPKNKRYDKIVLVTADKNTPAADKLRLAYAARETVIVCNEQDA